MCMVGHIAHAGIHHHDHIMTLIMVMHSLSKTSTQHYYNRNYKILIGAFMILSPLRVIRYLKKWT